ncbi:hypothetical protein GOP47_0022091 [Adiantum capillus-veneris]|uniref:Retrotransposon gag domain-containing protein n=1 Tax=Adiantum capillus-veneris TaxID=13818 RepID=A0A9D4U8N9_ADICA|nr:hypothetical protein GOP47_0022091 [Adiantum capillus-veneris]
MVDNSKESKINVDNFDFADEQATNDAPMLINYLVSRLQQAMGNPSLQREVQRQLRAHGILQAHHHDERTPRKPPCETPKRGLSPIREGLKNLLLDDASPSQRRTQEPPPKERERSESPATSAEMAPRRRQTKRSPSPPKRRRPSHSSPRHNSKRDDKKQEKKKARKRTPSSPSSSSSSSYESDGKDDEDQDKKKARKRSPSFPRSSNSSPSEESDGATIEPSKRRGHRKSYAAWKRSSKLNKFKEGGKSISFLTYDGTFGATNKVLAFIQQFDAAFGDEGFTESSKLRHVAMHFQKSSRQWWSSLQANGEDPRTWKALRASIMKQFLATDAKDKVITEWRSLKLSPYESIHKYVDKFWDLQLKATVFKKLDFGEQKQQFCAGLTEEMAEYVNSQRPRTISAVIHHTMVAS